jgi:hypothetical protein
LRSLEREGVLAASGSARIRLWFGYSPFAQTARALVAKSA